MSSSIEVARDGDMVIVTLNRPDAGNAIDLELARALGDAVRDAETSGASTMVLTAKGKVFCAGGDVKSMGEAQDPSAYLDELARTMHEALAAMTSSPVFVIAAVDGAVAGGGLGLVLSADYIIGTPRASFLTAYSGVGLTPDSGVSSHLVRTVGLHRALALVATSRVLGAEEAKDLGIVAEITESDVLETTAMARASRFTRTAGPALGQAKKLVRSAAETPLHTQLVHEQRAIADAVATPHAQGRIREFGVKRASR